MGLRRLGIPTQTMGWMAGIVDMRGKVLVKNNKKRNTRQIVLMVESGEMSIINTLGRLTGTKPDLQAPKPMAEFMRHGCLEHCPEAHIHANKMDLFLPAKARWTVTGAAMAVVLSNLMPMLTVDRGYPEFIREIVDNQVLVGQGATAVLRSVCRLRDCGWSIPEPYAGALEKFERDGYDALVA